jgi:hypothetical protein
MLLVLMREQFLQLSMLHLPYVLFKKRAGVFY